ncbi:sorbosone dehydrogenase [Sphingomonas sp. Sph1(2015)]|jgi:glucose/arabinose dehydrogenase|uniref:PQQ-dependent sugar dehydrogenase n=1 Tax=Sphingomonas sp. Sph1(2015) TaxID=1628084 RepID=UPI0009761CD6|nr:sorbosone dehydrogenase family protein [Sphingomonas sp. Sph1(2015)]OMJ31955.1 sorbosone dehydrogenase [Sphingomonas sp. Sph1(2015)]
MRKHVLIVLGIIVLIGIGVVTWLAWPDTARLSVDQVAGARPTIETPREQTIPTVDIAKPVGWANGAKPSVAPGLAIQPFASGLDHPRWLYQLPNGDVLVAETNSPPRPSSGIVQRVMNVFLGRAGAAVPSANRITLLRDTNGDGVADVKTPFLTGLNSPFGMVLFDGQLYIADTDALVRVPYQEGATKITAKPEKVVPLRPAGNHWARNVIASGDGKTLFVSVGSASNIAENGLGAEKNRAAILQVWPKDKNWRVYAGGLRNPNGMALNPVNGRLWTVVNERDMLGSDLVPDYLTQIEFGDHFGWPWYYWGGYPDNRVQPTNPPLQQYVKRPDYALGPHVAALGLTFSEGAKLGDTFARGAFIGEHGSWNRKPPSGYKVVFVPFAGAFPVPKAKPVEVVGGFLNAKGEARGRPVGVIVDKTGGLLVADDVGNVVWKVSAAK